MKAPLVSFVIGGAQKCGTTALARSMAQHPQLALPTGKEAHVFDAPDFEAAWTGEDIDRRYASHFAPQAPGVLYGDATPIYWFHETFVRRIRAYNPHMRWIIILRDPVDRAISQYRMERSRGDESWPLWPALLLERWRMRGHEADFSQASPLRRHSYRARGDYARQLDVLHLHFPEEQVLVLRNEIFASNPDATMAKICEFLNISPDPSIKGLGQRVFEGKYKPLAHGSMSRRLLQWLMRHQLKDASERYGLHWT